MFPRPVYQKIVVLGAGESGIGAAILARKEGYAVWVSEQKQIAPAYKALLQKHQIPFEENGHNHVAILEADLAIKSPGIAPNALTQNITKCGISLIDEIEWGYYFKKNARIIAVTGTNGKSTTSALIGHILKKAGKKAALCGNIGHSFAKQIAAEQQDYYVLELSSFQLENLQQFKADVAILLNISPDHLNRYASYEDYIRAKWRLVRNQTAADYFICNADDDYITQSQALQTIHSRIYTFSMTKNLLKGAFLKERELNVITEEEQWEMELYNLPLKGRHNAYNMLASGLAASVLGVKPQDIQAAFETFDNLEHRMEPVAEINGISFINDSKATNLNAAYYALESMTRPTILILGGLDKGNDYTLLEPLVRQKVKAIVCLGRDNTRILNHFKNQKIPLTDTHDTHDCVQACLKIAQKGDAVLLSPACASFDLFENYEHRGKEFKNAVRQCS